MELLSEWHHYVYGILTILFVVVYIIHFLPTQKLGRIKAILEAETILMLVLIFVAVIASRVEHVAENSDQRWEQANALLQRLGKREGFEEIKRLGTTDAIFRELSQTLEHTDREVWATGLRPETPKEHVGYTGEAGQWYGNLDRWVNAKSGRTYMRLIGLSNDETREWFQEECAKETKISNRVFRGIEWNADMPFVNMVIFDDDEVFMSLRPDPYLIETTIRYHVKGPEMTHLAKEYFRALWAKGTGCKDLQQVLN